MIRPLVVLIVCAAITVLAVRLLLIRGIVGLGQALRLSNKTEGQIIGYATSVPELVVLVASALAGVFDAGFWNIASSNTINWVLFLFAVFAFRQERDLFTRGFIDELAFGAASVAVPMVLYGTGAVLSPLLALGSVEEIRGLPGWAVRPPRSHEARGWAAHSGVDFQLST